MVVFPPLVYYHVPRGSAHRGAMAVRGVLLLPQGAGACAERSEAERAEGGATEQAGVRGDLHDRGERLGRGADLRTDYHRPDPG